MSIIEKQTPIYEVFEQSFNPPSSPIRDTNTTSVISNDIVNDAETDKSNYVFNNALSIGEELTRLTEEGNKPLENRFKEKVLPKIKCDLNSMFFKHHTAKFLDETFAAMPSDDSFFR